MWVHFWPHLGNFGLRTRHCEWSDCATTDSRNSRASGCRDPNIPVARGQTSRHRVERDVTVRRRHRRRHRTQIERDATRTPTRTHRPKRRHLSVQLVRWLRFARRTRNLWSRFTSASALFVRLLTSWLGWNYSNYCICSTRKTKWHTGTVHCTGCISSCTYK